VNGSYAWRRRISRAATYACLISAAIVTGYPIVWLISGAFKSRGEMFTNFWALPGSLQLDNLARAWTQAGIGQNLINSLVVSVGAVLVTLALAIPAAYAFVSLSIPGKTWLLVGVVLTLMIRPTFNLVGLFRLFAATGLENTYQGLILVYAVTSLPFAIAVLTAYIQAIPADLRESARLEGAGDWRILRSIIVPLIGPAVSVVVILTFLDAYNDLIVALTVWNGEQMKTLSIGLSSLVGARNLDYPALFAGTAASLVPVVLLFIIFQRRFINGFLSGATQR
jgi:raffinose/stachyose/melibiose transport system permease protein